MQNDNYLATRNQLLIKNCQHNENISKDQKNIFEHFGSEIIQLQGTFRGVCRCVYALISLNTIDI